MKVEIITSVSHHRINMGANSLADWLMQSSVDRIEVADRVVVRLGDGCMTDAQKQAWIEANLGIRAGGCCG